MHKHTDYRNKIDQTQQLYPSLTMDAIIIVISNQFNQHCNHYKWMVIQSLDFGRKTTSGWWFEPYPSEEYDESQLGLG